MAEIGVEGGMESVREAASAAFNSTSRGNARRGNAQNVARVPISPELISARPGRSLRRWPQTGGKQRGTQPGKSPVPGPCMTRLWAGRRLVRGRSRRIDDTPTQLMLKAQSQT